MLALRRSCIVFLLVVVSAGCLGPAGDPAAGATGPQAAQTGQTTVFLAQPPNVIGGLDPRSVLEATRSGILLWSANGGPNIRFVSDAGNADIYTEYVKEWGGDRLGVAFSSGVLQIGLGNSECNRKWTPFDTASLRHIAGHEMGHALGHDHSQDPLSIMYAVSTPRYSKACELFSGTVSVAADQYYRFPFPLDHPMPVNYDFAERADGTISICLYKDGSEYGCTEVVRSKANTLQLSPGQYEFQVACENWFDRCSLEYLISTGP